MENLNTEQRTGEVPASNVIAIGGAYIVAAPSLSRYSPDSPNPDPSYIIADDTHPIPVQPRTSFKIIDLTTAGKSIIPVIGQARASFKIIDLTTAGRLPVVSRALNADAKRVVDLVLSGKTPREARLMAASGL